MSVRQAIPKLNPYRALVVIGRFRALLSRFHKKQGIRRPSQDSPLELKHILRKRISYQFRSEPLLRQALTHRSCFYSSEEHWLSNERLELLGDAVLGLVVTETLYRQYPRKSEGELTRMKSLMVSREILVRQAEKMDLGKYLILGDAEDHSGGRKRRSILADAFEALLGAVYLDGGCEPARDFVHEFLYRDMNRFVREEFSDNYKSMLLEYCQGRGDGVPRYRVVRERGPDHQKEFTVEVLMKGTVMGSGRGFTKKKAEQEAAFKAVKAVGLPIQKANT